MLLPVINISSFAKTCRRAGPRYVKTKWSLQVENSDASKRTSQLGINTNTIGTVGTGTCSSDAGNTTDGGGAACTKRNTYQRTAGLRTRLPPGCGTTAGYPVTNVYIYTKAYTRKCYIFMAYP